MTLTRASRLRPALFAAAMLLLAAAGPLPAQQPRIPPDARGYQTFLIQQQAQQRSASRPSAPAPITPAPRRSQAASPVYVKVDVPDAPALVAGPTTYVTIRGPDGVVRRFPLERGVRVEYQSGWITLRPGQSTTIRLTTVY